jgi:hypothetical protein
MSENQAVSGPFDLECDSAGGSGASGMGDETLVVHVESLGV